ncbi:MAG: hypothetical protein ACFCU8_14455 [Thermosynechococcaceae cyanobacterium]
MPSSSKKPSEKSLSLEAKLTDGLFKFFVAGGGGYSLYTDIPQVRLSPNQFPLSWPIEEYFFGSK